MTIEQSPKNEKDNRPTELAPFRKIEHLSPREEFLWVNSLSGYLEDPYTARMLEMRKFDIDDGHTGEWRVDYVRQMSDAARDSLDTIATQGKTFLAQELARGLVGSPLARVFDERSGHQPGLVSPSDTDTRERYLNLLSRPRVDTPIRLTEAEERALTLQAKRETARWGDADGALVERAKARILTRFSHTERTTTGKRIFAEAEAELARQGYLQPGSLETDELFLINRFKGDFVAMQARMWHMAYEMPVDDEHRYVRPFRFMMTAYGEVGQNEVSADFHDKFINQEPIEYTEIIKAGLTYAPVMTSTDSIGFYEESGRLVQLFHATKGLEHGDRATPIDIDARVREVLIGASDADVEATAQTFHLLAGNLQTRNIMEAALNVRFDELLLDEQVLLCKLLIRATPEQMKSVTRHDLEVVRDVVRALEYGDDYGDSILAIAEYTTPEQSKEVFRTINHFRESSARLADWYMSYDPELARDFELAMNERLTDSLAALEVLVHDSKLEIDVSPGRNAEDYEPDGRFDMKLHSIEEGLEILRSLEKSLSLMHDIVTAEDVQVHQINKDGEHFAMYRFSSDAHGDALLYIRPEGAKGYDPQLEYGNRDGVEASISFIVNPTDPHHLDVYKDPQGVSIRFDREGRMSDESPFSEDRDPTREDGSISLDISSIMGDGRHMPVKIGRLVAAGNILRAAKTGGEESLHHNNNHFEQSKYGTAEGFSKLAVYMAHMAEAMISIQRNGSHASPYQSIPANQR